jgi:2-phosphoglycerate kinase
MRPVIVLIGGATGTGKSTVATEVAHRLGIHRITSTDDVRQTLRAFFTPAEKASIHRSSYDAPPGQTLVDAFLWQTAEVLVAVEAAVSRAVLEGWSMIVEGVHIVPGMLTLSAADATIVECVLTIEDEQAHAGHFWIRDASSGGERPVKKYLDHLDDIRRLQDFIVERARDEDIPVLENSKVDETVGAVMELVLGNAAEQLEAV